MARINIRIGPMIQFNNSETPSTFVFLKTSFNLPYFTFVNGGYIINIRPIAKGILVVPVEKELMIVAEDGMKYPIATPITIATKIHSVRNRSKKLNFFLSCAGAQWFADIDFFFLL